MANTSGLGTTWNLPNYIGTIYMVGSNNKTPFLNMMGGLEGGMVRMVGSQVFAVSQPFDLATASSPAISESAAASIATAYQYVTSIEYNTCQIVQRKVEVTYAKMSDSGQITAHTDASYRVDTSEFSAQQNALDKQINSNLKQIAKNLEYSCFQGTYTKPTASTVAAQTRGLEAVCALTGSTTVAAGSVDLSKDLVNELMRGMLDKGAEFENPVIFCNAFQKQQLSNEYGYEPENRNVGGVNIQQIVTDFAILGVAYSPQVSTDTIVIADMSVCHPVWWPVPGKGILFYEEISKEGASERGQIYGQFGLDYGPMQYHGSCTGLTTS